MQNNAHSVVDGSSSMYIMVVVCTFCVCVFLVSGMSSTKPITWFTTIWSSPTVAHSPTTLLYDSLFKQEISIR